MNFLDKILLFKVWRIVTLVGNIFLMIGVVCFYLTNSYDLDTAECFLGLGTFLIWFSFTQYFTTWVKYSTIWRTIVKAVPAFIKTGIGISPFIISTALLFFLLFNRNYDVFGNYSKSLWNLLAMQCGDAVQDIYNDSIDIRLVFLIFLLLFVHQFGAKHSHDYCRRRLSGSKI
jgi:hypothetical protein